MATGTFIVISAAGLLLPGVTLEGSIESLTGGPGHWLNSNLNFSLALVLVTPGVPASRWSGHVGSATTLLLLIAIYRMDEVIAPAETTQGATCLTISGLLESSRRRMHRSRQWLSNLEHIQFIG